VSAILKKDSKQRKAIAVDTKVIVVITKLALASPVYIIVDNILQMFLFDGLLYYDCKI